MFVYFFVERMTLELRGIEGRCRLSRLFVWVKSTPLQPTPPSLAPTALCASINHLMFALVRVCYIGDNFVESLSEPARAMFVHKKSGITFKVIPPLEQNKQNK